jgi:hypothetical protein
MALRVSNVLKMDDGRPGRGKMIAMWHSACTDSGADQTNLDADYDFSKTGKECSVIFRNAF